MLNWEGRVTARPSLPFTLSAMRRLPFVLCCAALAIAVCSVFGWLCWRQIQSSEELEAGSRTRGRPPCVVLYQSRGDDLVAKEFNDFSQAAEWIDGLPNDTRLPQQIALAKQWGAVDFDATLAWVLAYRDEALRGELMRSLGKTAIASSPEKVMRLVDYFSDTSARSSFLEEVVQSWARSNPAAAMTWAESADDEVRGVLQSTIATEVAQSDPQVAATYVAEKMSPGADQDQAALNIAMRWAHLDPKAATAWAVEFPQSDLRERLITAVSSISAR